MTTQNAKIEGTIIYINMNGKWENYAEFHKEEYREHRQGVVDRMNNDETFFARIKKIHIRNKNTPPKYDPELGWTHQQG